MDVWLDWSGSATFQTSLATDLSHCQSLGLLVSQQSELIKTFLISTSTSLLSTTPASSRIHTTALHCSHFPLALVLRDIVNLGSENYKMFCLHLLALSPLETKHEGTSLVCWETCKLYNLVKYWFSTWNYIARIRAGRQGRQAVRKKFASILSCPKAKKRQKSSYV